MDFKVIFSLISICFIWGYLWVVIKLGLQTFPPLLFSALRLIFGSIVLLLVLIVLKKSILPKNSEWIHLVILSIMMCVGYYGISTVGMQYVSSGIASILVYTMPIIIGFLGHYFLEEKLTSQKIVGLFIGAIGLLSIIWPEVKTLHWDLSLVGNLLMIISATFWAISIIYIKKIFSDYEKIKLTFWQMFVGGLILLVISIFVEKAAGIQWNTPKNIFYLFYSSVLGTALAFVCWNWILSKIDASVASMSIMSVPLLGLLFGHFILNEPLHSTTLLGTFLICIGISLHSVEIKKLQQYFKNTPTI
ncbi:DMT family transporter [Acinetobacter sp. SA01]|jgi:drug/metabolite transporter (DMT)-like permease|uniref:DMT family transporter n=1 Tax=Acinetobacter sp. SA01 TaxID=1862567 RepID=UPI00140D11A4|nr:DMT family transporter [Acinetobacter sp. SA01]